MRVRCMSIPDFHAKAMAGEVDAASSALVTISVFDPGRDREVREMSVCETLSLQFADTLHGDGSMTLDDAEAVLSFAESAFARGKSLYVCCDGGVSRSAAVAGFVEVFMLGEHGGVFRDPRKSPNERVLATLAVQYSRTRGDDGSLDGKVDALFRLWEASEQSHAEYLCETFGTRGG